MKNQITNTNEPIGKVKVVTNFLPSPAELAVKNQKVKVAISLSAESVEYF